MTNEDRALLKLAASACYEGLRSAAEIWPIQSKTGTGDWVTWNPLVNRSDANALQEQLLINVIRADGKWLAYKAKNKAFDPDMNRAITLCAAEIGRKMG